AAHGAAGVLQLRGRGDALNRRRRCYCHSRGQTLMAYDIKAASNLLIELPPFPPIIRGWNRLEGRPRAVDYERALRAEVRDALWFLTRQWQFGELQGEDAGSPIDARVVVRSTPLLHFALPGQPATPFDATRPLEARVEGERAPRDLDFHIELSRQFFRRVAA